jgi:hypothetical protein
MSVGVRDVGEDVDEDLPAARPELLQADAPEHGMQPRADRLGIANRPDAAHGEEARVLDGVFGVLAVADKPQRRREEPRTVALEQHPQSSGIPTARLDGEFPVGR